MSDFSYSTGVLMRSLGLYTIVKILFIVFRRVFLYRIHLTSLLFELKDVLIKSLRPLAIA